MKNLLKDNLRMKNKWIRIIFSILIVICGLYYIVFLAPYNLMEERFANGLGVINNSSIKSIPELDEYFKGIDVNRVKYLGSSSYEVYTNRGEYIIIADYSDSVFWKYKIFKYDKQVKYFTNPM
jgi:hypothetical protein